MAARRKKRKRKIPDKSTLCVRISGPVLAKARGAVKAQLMAGDMNSSLRRLVEAAIDHEVKRLEEELGATFEEFQPGGLPVGGRLGSTYVKKKKGR